MELNEKPWRLTPKEMRESYGMIHHEGEFRAVLRLEKATQHKLMELIDKMLVPIERAYDSQGDPIYGHWLGLTGEHWKDLQKRMETP